MSILEILIMLIETVLSTYTSEKGLVIKAKLWRVLNNTRAIEMYKTLLSAKRLIAKGNVTLQQFIESFRKDDLILEPELQKYWCKMCAEIVLSAGLVPLPVKEDYITEDGRRTFRWVFNPSSEERAKWIKNPFSHAVKHKKAKMLGLSLHSYIGKDLDRCLETLDIINSVKFSYKDTVKLEAVDEGCEAYIEAVNYQLSLLGTNEFHLPLGMDSRGRIYINAPTADFIGSKKLRVKILVNGREVSLFDAKTSGAAIMVTITRDSKGIELIATKDLYTKLYMAVNEAMGLKYYGFNPLDRNSIKKPCQKFFYGCGVTHNDLAESMGVTAYAAKQYLKYCFDDAYIKAVPGAFALRQLALDAFSSDMFCREWVLPDGFEVCVPFVRTVEQRVDLQVYDLDLDTGKSEKIGKYSTSIYTKTLGGVKPNEKGSKSIGANQTHSLDAYNLREVHRMCNYPSKGWLAQKIAYINQGTKQIEDPTLLHILECYSRTGIASVRGLWYINDYVSLPEDYKRDLLASVSHMAKEPFPVMSIHDCFGCHPEHSDELQRIYAWIMGTLYKGTMLEEFGMVEAYQEAYNEDVYQSILNGEWMKYEAPEDIDKEEDYLLDDLEDIPF